MKFRLVAALAALTLVSACGGSEDAATDMEDVAVQEEYVSEGYVEQENLSEFLMAAKDRVFFAFDSAIISEEAADVLKLQIAWLKANPDAKIVLEGHCDERGTREYNLALGEKRANAVKRYMVLNGIEGDRVVTRSYGKDHPAVIGNNEAAWAQNRRTVTIVSK